MRWLAALILALAPTLALAQCWPAELGGCGTTTRAALVKADPPDAETNPQFCVFYWYESAPQDPLGWRVSHVWKTINPGDPCAVPTSWPAYIPAASLASLWALWDPKSLESVHSWAYVIWMQDFALPGMPPKETWVVAKASSTASPPGTRPTYTYTPPATVGGFPTLKLDGQRINEGSPCNCALTKYNDYCSVGGVQSRVAVCAKTQP